MARGPRQRQLQAAAAVQHVQRCSPQRVLLCAPRTALTPRCLGTLCTVSPRITPRPQVHVIATPTTPNPAPPIHPAALQGGASGCPRRGGEEDLTTWQDSRTEVGVSPERQGGGGSGEKP